MNRNLKSHILEVVLKEEEILENKGEREWRGCWVMGKFGNTVDGLLNNTEILKTLCSLKLCF